MIPTDILNSHCERALRRPFSWGTDDCCTFACDVMQESFGIDPMDVMRGQYESEEAATRWIENVGGLAELALRRAWEHKLERVAFPYSTAHIGVIAESRGPMLAVSDSVAWIARGQTGIVRLPLWRAVLAWRAA